MKRRAAGPSLLACGLLIGGLVCAGCHLPGPNRLRADAWDGLAVPIVDPGEARAPNPPPSDAVVLFDGSTLDRWRHPSGAAPRWRVNDGSLEITPGTGDLETVEAFGDLQLHLEWATPSPPEGRGQHRGNSGIKFMGLYELQILDSYENPTYPDGQAGAVYGVEPPAVNASRPPGRWQAFDVLFRVPRFSRNGRLLAPATLTAWHNGVLIQDAVVLSGPTGGLRPGYRPHPSRLPLVLQEHGHPVRFRNIWVRRLDGQGEDSGTG